MADSWKELELQIMKAITEAMENEVKAGAIKCGEDHVETDVYDAYISDAENPYSRTGLLKESFKGEMLDNSTLEITNTRTDGDRNVVEVVEYGRGYYSNEMDEKIGARRFMMNTQEDLELGKARELLTEGLKKRLGNGNVF